MRFVQTAFCVFALSGVLSTASAQTISDNACEITLNPSTLSFTKYGDDAIVGTPDATVVLTAAFATQGCSCVEEGDQGFDNPDGIVLVTPGGSDLQPFKFNDIDGYAQFEYAVTATDLTNGSSDFVVKVFDSCQGQDVLVDQADFRVDFNLTEVPTPPTTGSVKACVSNSGGIRIVAAEVTCKATERTLILATPPN